MEALGREGPVFDSFSDSREGSLRGGNSLKSPIALSAQGCLIEAAAHAAARAATPDDSPGPGAKEEQQPGGVGTTVPSRQEAAPDGLQRAGLDSEEAAVHDPSPGLRRPGSMDTTSLTSSFEFSTQGSLASTSLSHLPRADSCASASAPIHERDPDTLPLHWRQAVEDADVPRSALLDHPAPVGALPSPRWGHAHAAVADRLYIFGGDGPGMHAQGNAFCFDPVQNAWRLVALPPAGHEDALPAMAGHAACAMQSRIFIFGGRQGRKYLRRTYLFDTVRGTWKCLKKAQNNPPGLAGHSLTAVGQHGIYLFGGAGSKRPSGDVHRCDPDTLAWSPVDTTGERPAGRQGHTAVWDHSDSLIVFGGLGDTAVFGDVHMLSLSTGYWSRPACAGHAPPQRYGHSACMVAANLMLVFGGCNAQGRYFSDLHVLNTSTFRWHRLGAVGALPAPRYGQACCALAGRVVVHGGSNGTTAFGSLFTITVSFGHDFNRAALSLAAQIRTGRGSSSSGSAASQEGADAEAARSNLAALLERRSAHDMQAFAARRADISEGLLQKERARSADLQAQIQELRLLLEEQQSAKEAAREELRQERLASKRTAERAHTNHMRHMQAHAAELAQLQAQHGVLTARCGDLESKNRTLEERCAGLRSDVDTLRRDKRALDQRLQAVQAQLAQQGLEAEAATTRLAAAQERAQVLQQHSDALAASLAQKEAALQAAARRQDAQCPASAATGHAGSQQRQQQPAQLLACLRGEAAALSRCSLGQLYSLEGTLSSSWRSLREAITTRGAQDLRDRESALAEKERAAEELTTCSLCMDGPKAVAFSCGHQTCSKCSSNHTACPFCRQPILTRITLFQT